jgi:hypothetical protein
VLQLLLHHLVFSGSASTKMMRLLTAPPPQKLFQRFLKTRLFHFNFLFFFLFSKILNLPERKIFGLHYIINYSACCKSGTFYCGSSFKMFRIQLGISIRNRNAIFTLPSLSRVVMSFHWYFKSYLKIELVSKTLII